MRAWRFGFKSLGVEGLGFWIQGVWELMASGSRSLGGWGLGLKIWCLGPISADSATTLRALNPQFKWTLNAKKPKP